MSDQWHCLLKTVLEGSWRDLGGGFGGVLEGSWWDLILVITNVNTNISTNVSTNISTNLSTNIRYILPRFVTAPHGGVVYMKLQILFLF